VPCSATERRFLAGQSIPIEGRCFPQGLETVIKLESAAVPYSAPRVQRRHSASQHLCADTEPAIAGHQLHVHTRAWPQRARTFDERTAAAQIDQRHCVSGPENGVGSRNRGLPEPRVEPAIG